jgi:recombination protein RecT
MANITTTQQKAQPKFSVAIKGDAYQKLINVTLGDKEVARKFVAEISSVVSQNYQLQECEAGSILSAGLLAQSVNLSLAPSLGLAYLVPYNSKSVKKAQFQISYKGLIQLAQRSGVISRLNARAVHENEIGGYNRFGEPEFVFGDEFQPTKIVGYFAYFITTQGFEKTMYMTVEQCKAHAKKYSKSYGNGKGTDLWTDDFDFMCKKTVLKLLLNRYAPLSIEMQKAIQADQATVNTDGSFSYVDNPNYVEDEQPKRKTTVRNTIEEVDEETGEVNEFDSYVPSEETLV